METLQGPDPALTAVRLNDGLASAMPRTVTPRPRLTCQQRLYPPPTTPRIRVGTQAMTIFGGVHFRQDVYLPDFMEYYPDKLYLPDAMLLAHEMVHVWQWQRRDITGYHPLKAALEHRGGRDPYRFDTESAAPYLSFGYEQQGAIMEEYVCCKALAPQAARTQRLHAMLAEVFDLPPLDTPLASEIYLPWDGIEIDGICGA